MATNTGYKGVQGKIIQVGSGKAIYLPAWFCEQVNLQLGQEFTMKPDADSPNCLTIIFGKAKKSLDRR